MAAANSLDDFIRLLESADPEIKARTARQFRVTLTALLAYARSIMHQHTGNMRRSSYLLGPFAVGNGILEGQIASGVWYTEKELERGGQHDWATRTLDERKALITALEIECSAEVMRVLGLE